VRNQVAGAQLCEALMTWFARGDLLTERWVERYVAVRGQLPPSPALMGYDPAVTDGFDANGAVRRVARAAAGFDMDVLPCRDGCLVINCTGVTAEVDLEEHAPRLERGIGSVTKSGAGIALGPGAAAVLGNG
jgi:hypothetical protein